MIGFGDALYTELWKLCAGPLVSLPGLGERVFYFPQGELERVHCFNPLIALVFTLFPSVYVVSYWIKIKICFSYIVAFDYFFWVSENCMVFVAASFNK